jgi:hypothetical protein
MCCSRFEVVDLNHPWKAGFVEPSGIIVLLLLLVGPLAVATAGGYIRSLYRLCVRRYERSLADSYSLNFQSRAIEARTLNANVGYALTRAKRTVDEARKGSSDPRHAQAALQQVSEWLDTAAETSDRALRSLERDDRSTKRSQSVISTRDDFHD